MALVQMNFESRYLNNNHEISIILPDMPRDKTPAEFYGSGRKYKVLWLLHGTFGDHSDWIRKSNIELYACEKDLIVVMPSGLNANYANWEHFSIGYNMYDYLTEELMPLIYNWFPASDKREDNFIAGLSMGGSGTLVYALNHPEKFAAAAVLSCCPFRVGYDSGDTLGDRTRGMIENRGGLEAYLNSYENTWGILDKHAKDPALPRFYFAVGKDDFLYESYNIFKKHAAEIGGAAAAAGLGHHQRDVVEVVFAALEGGNHLADGEQRGVADVVVDVFQPFVHDLLPVVGQKLYVVAVGAEGVLQNAEMDFRHVGEEELIGLPHLLGKFDAASFISHAYSLPSRRWRRTASAGGS